MPEVAYQSPTTPAKSPLPRNKSSLVAIAAVVAQSPADLSKLISKVLEGKQFGIKPNNQPFLDHAELNFDVAGVRRYIDVIIVDELEADCLLNADFMQKFNAILRPR